MSNRGIRILIVTLLLTVCGASCAVAQQLLFHSCDIPHIKESDTPREKLLPMHKQETAMRIARFADNNENNEPAKRSTTSYINNSNTTNNHSKDVDLETSLRHKMKETLNSILDYLADTSGLNKKDKNNKDKRSNVFAYLLYDNTPKCRLRGSRVKLPNDTLPQLLTSSFNSPNTHYAPGYNTQWHSLMARHGYIRNNSYVNCLLTPSLHFVPAGESQQQLLVQYAHAGRNGQDRENNEL